MTATLKRQLDSAEKLQILERYGRKCFATGHDIGPDEQLQFDHIHAFSAGGPSDLNNIAPMCDAHNKKKGVLPLGDFRVKLRLSEFFSAGSGLTLKHLLEYLHQNKDIAGYGQRVQVQVQDGTALVEDEQGRTQTYTLYSCPTTGWQYFYATLPVELLDSDDDEDHKIGLQPRYLLPDKVFELYRHFQRHPVLQPSIGRLHQQRILLFDGQHKAAALLWNGRKEFECKIYLAPDLRLLNDTNISAHDKFAQTRFYSSIMVAKLGSQFGADFEQYKGLEDGQPKSETGFIKFLVSGPKQGSKSAEVTQQFRSYLYNAILESPENKAAALVSKGNRSSLDAPLTMDVLTKSLFMHFLYREPVSDNLATDSYRRDVEIENNVALMNMLFDLALSSWDPKAGPNNDHQRKLNRLFGSKSMMAWSEILHSAICGKLDIDDADERDRIFYRELNDEQMATIKKVVQRLVDWSHWLAPAKSEIDDFLAGSKDAAKHWLRNHGLTTGYLGGAGE